MRSLKADIRKINTRLSGKHGLRNQGSQVMDGGCQANADGTHPVLEGVLAGGAGTCPSSWWERLGAARSSPWNLRVHLPCATSAFPGWTFIF